MVQETTCDVAFFAEFVHTTWVQSTSFRAISLIPSAVCIWRPQQTRGTRNNSGVVASTGWWRTADTPWLELQWLVRWNCQRLNDLLTHNFSDSNRWMVRLVYFVLLPFVDDCGVNEVTSEYLFHAVALVVFLYQPVQCHCWWFSSRSVTFVVEYFTPPGSIRERQCNSCSLYLALADIFFFISNILCSAFRRKCALTSANTVNWHFGPWTQNFRRGCLKSHRVALVTVRCSSWRNPSRADNPFSPFRSRVLAM